MSFLTTMNTNEVYNLQLRLKWLKQGPKADGESDEPEVEDFETEVDSADGLGKIRKKFKKINLRKDHKIRRRDGVDGEEEGGWDYTESDPEAEANVNPHVGVEVPESQDASRFQEVDDVNADHPYNNWKRPSRDAKRVAAYITAFEEESASAFEKNLLAFVQKTVEHQNQSAYEKGALLYQSFHEVFSLIADIRFFHVMAGKIEQPADGEKMPSRTDDTAFVQKLFTKNKEKLPEYPHLRPDDEL